MMLHLVTDRLGLAPAADEESVGRCLVEQARFAVAAGVDVIQVRERDLDGRPLVTLVRTLVRATRRSATRVVVNDRLDVALAARADGVHLRADSMESARIRACTRPGFLIGRSVHSVDEARAAGPVDYLLAGAVWPTTSKPSGHPLLGAAGLQAVVAAAAVPVLAIGGVRPDRGADIARAGAAGAAAIGAWRADDGECRATAVKAVAEAFRAGFDAANMGPGSSPG